MGRGALRSWQRSKKVLEATNVHSVAIGDTHEQMTMRHRKNGSEVSGVALLYKAFRVLDAVAEAPTPPRIADLLATTDLSKGTLYRLVQALVDRRYLRVDPGDQTYRLGTRLFDLAHKVWESFDLRAAAASELTALRDRLGETTRLSVLDGYQVLYVDQVDTSNELRVASGVGSRAPSHASSAGKAMLSALDPGHRREALSRLDYEKLTPNTIDSEDAFNDHLDFVAALGYATSIEERVTGISSVSAPILDPRRQPIGALTVTGPSSRLDPDRLTAVGRDLIDCARRIAGNAGMFSDAYSVSTSPRPAMAIGPEVACAVETRAVQGEGPIWSIERQELYWVDILGPALHVYNQRLDHNRTIPLPFMVSSIARTDGPTLLLATQKGVQSFDLHTSRLSLFVDPEPDRRSNRLNDSKVDRRGRLWVGSMAIDGTPGHGSLYCIDRDGRCTLKDSGFAISNGIGWSPDDRFLYFVDSGTSTIYRYDFDIETGDIARQNAFIRVPDDKGRPGGLTVDDEGYLWVAHYDGWFVARYDPDGHIDRIVPLPVPRPTSCIFGGPQMSQLFVTSARIRLSAERIAEAPLSGSVLVISTECRGLPEPTFGSA